MVKSSAFKAIVVGCAVLGGTATALANDLKDVSLPGASIPGVNGLSFHVGQFFPSSSVARNWEGGRWFLAGFEYDVSNRYNVFGAGVGASITADVYSKGSFTAVPIVFNATSHVGRTRMGAGLGVSFVHRKDEMGTSFADTELAYNAFFSYDVIEGQSPVFLQVKYFGCSRPDLNGFGVSIGTHF